MSRSIWAATAAASSQAGRRAGWGRGASERAGRARARVARHGIACPPVPGAGTGSFEFEAASGVYTELQCGSYIFMDADYGRNLDRDGAPIKGVEASLFSLAS